MESPRFFACFMVLSMMLVGPAGASVPPGGFKTSAEAGGTEGTGGRATATPDGLYWMDDCRLTNNPSEDTHPMLAVDGSWSSGVVWDRGGNILWKKVDKDGNELIPEKMLVAGAFPEGAGKFCAQIIGVDSKGCNHLCASPGGNGATYSKYDYSGNWLVAPKGVPSGATNPHAPTIAVSRNDIVHMTYTEGVAGQTVVRYARILSDGTVDKNGIGVSPANSSSDLSNLATDFKNNVHITYADMANGCYHCKLDNMGNPLPEAPPTFLFKDASATTWPASVGCDGLGNVHILWNNAGNGTGTLKYMKLNNNGVKLAAGPFVGIPLTNAPTCKGFPCIQGDSRGNAYAIWSDTRDGNDEIYYLKIVPGTENDTNLPNKAISLTKDSAGSALEPRLALDPDDNLHVVWKDDRDGNYEIYYRFASNFGIEVGMTPEEMYKIMFVHPNETKSANVTVRNTGGQNDTAHLALVPDFHGHDGWKVKMETTDLILKPQQVRKIKVSVTGPSFGADGDYIDVNITANSAGNPNRTGSIIFRTYLQVARAINLYAPNDRQTTPAGVETSYKIVGSNTGDYNETVDLQVTGPPDWAFRANVSSITVPAHKTVTAILYVTPPPNAEGDAVGIVKVTGTTAASPVLADSFVTYTAVARHVSISLSPDRINGTVDPGGTAGYNLTISEEGNYFVLLNFTLNITTNTSGWNVSLDPPFLQLKSGSVRSVALNITAPADAEANSSLVVRVSCRDENRTVNASCAVNTTVRRVDSIVISKITKNVGLSSGKRTVFELLVTNNGNSNERLRPGPADIPPGWQARLELLNGSVIRQSAPLAVKAHETWTLRFVVVQPETCVCGIIPIPGSLVDDKGNPYGFGVDIPVQQVFGIGLTSAREAWAEPGGRVRLDLQVCNTGNGPDTLNMICSALPDWSIMFCTTGKASIDELRLGPFFGWNETVEVSLPSSCREETIYFIFLATSSGGASGIAQTMIHVRHANLQLIDLACSSDRPLAGERVTISLTVCNTGELDACNVTVVLKDGNRIVALVRLERVLAGGSEIVDFIWNATPGHHILMVDVDPDDTVAEPDETDNTIRWPVDVAAAKPAASGNSGMTAPAAALGIALLVAVVVIAARGRKRGRSGTGTPGAPTNASVAGRPRPPARPGSPRTQKRHQYPGR
jgi:uncharacterized membrane protein